MSGKKQTFSKRAELLALAEDIRATRIRAKNLGRTMMKSYKQSMEEGMTFVEFLRTIDPSIPLDRKLYRNHPVYQAGDYMRRLAVGVMSQDKDNKAMLKFLLSVLKQELKEYDG